MKGLKRGVVACEKQTRWEANRCDRRRRRRRNLLPIMLTPPAARPTQAHDQLLAPKQAVPRPVATPWADPHIAP